MAAILSPLPAREQAGPPGPAPTADNVGAAPQPLEPSRPHWMWPLTAALVSLAPFAAGLHPWRAFSARDLNLHFWSRHLWLRRTVFSGEWPFWDRFAGAGQATDPDALNQLFHPIAMLVRLGLPATLGFNLWVALPAPLAALGAYCFFARHVAAPAACLGAALFGVSGPLVSSANFPNVSWSIAGLPWVLWSVDGFVRRPGVRQWAALASLFALQAVAGEPVTLAASLGLALAYVTVGAELPGVSWRVRTTRLLQTGFALGTGVLLAAVQLVPLVAATRLSPRGFDGTNTTMWSLHPLALLETFMPYIFGDFLRTPLPELPWLPPLNGGREPFFFSLYVGPVALFLALVGLLRGRRRWALFWFVSTVTATVMALGVHTPLYQPLQAWVPLLRVFRYPAKYMLFTVLGVSALAAGGWQAWLERPASGGARSSWPAWVVAALAVALAVTAYGLLLVKIAAPRLAAERLSDLAVHLGARFNVSAVLWMFFAYPPQASRLTLVALGTAGFLLIAWSCRHEARLAGGVLFALAILDPLISNIHLNPTSPVGDMGPPAWIDPIVRTGDRFYLGGRPSGSMTSADVHGPRWWSYPAHRPLAEWRTAVTSQVVVSPGGWGIREVVSHDLPVLWPYWHEAMRQRFQQASHEERLRFLERVGVRYCALPEPPRPDARPLVRIPWVGSHALYDCGTRVSRASVVAGAIIQPSLKGQLDLMFEDKAFDPLATVLLNAAPPAGAGVPGPPQPPSARIVEESATRITVEATTGPRGGFLVLLDSQHPYWRASVDGRPARILPANAVFRAVRLAPGRHVVRFVYRPVPLMAGAAVSGVVGLALLATVRRRGARPRGDTNRHPI